ncbi:hypothetical protein [Streptomyces roseolilacinus]|uniref:Uncharacterized protein n=1 Tax=Streptomyces roseolilacinus TaxID=66904 RepID=A0A918EPB4_9ACTN|nr:hypothetical protein [Streptomyces roseolilacinus]GGQ26517.1 hypothetical protein GCM10010249_51390 [Streptomyces roseolilacinus]
MPHRTLRATLLLAVAAAVAAPAAAAAPAPSPPSVRKTAAAAAAPAPPRAREAVTVSSLKGDARMDYPVADEEVRVSVDARSTYAAGSVPRRSWGTFRISHSQGGTLYWGEFEVDCLTTGGPTATVTGRLVRASPGHPWLTLLDPHTRMGVSFLVPEKGEARIGLSGATGKGEPLLTACMAPAADAKVVDGGYTLRDREGRAPHRR